MVFYYFDSLDGLFVELFRRGAERSFERLQDALSSTQPLWGFWDLIHDRAGSALTAEIGIMRITEQIDALTVMALNPMRYLTVPSLLAGLITFPMMTALFDTVGIFGGYLVGVQLQGHLFDQLVDFRGPDFTQTPLVAERWENPDPTTWRFHLRKGIKFHDGKELTAEDVKFSFELAQASTTGKAKVANVVDVKIVDRHTVEVKTSGPAASLLANLAWVFILPKAAFQAFCPITTYPGL